MIEKDKYTTLILNWGKKRGSSSLAIEYQGDDLPDEIKVMLASHLLRDLRGKLSLDVSLR